MSEVFGRGKEKKETDNTVSEETRKWINDVRQIKMMKGSLLETTLS